MQCLLERQVGNRWVTVQRKRINVRGGRFADQGAPEEGRACTASAIIADGVTRRRTLRAPCTEVRAVSFRTTRRMYRLLTWLPRGRALPPEVWAARHRGLLLVLAAHLVLLPAFAVSQGWSLAAGWAFDIGPAAFGALACWPRLLARLALLDVRDGAAVAARRVLVVAWHGTTEAHFHYFVMVGALALYEEWWAYLLAIAFVVLQHGVISVWETGAVFDHDRHARGAGPASTACSSPRSPSPT